MLNVNSKQETRYRRETNPKFQSERDSTTTSSFLCGRCWGTVLNEGAGTKMWGWDAFGVVCGRRVIREDGEREKGAVSDVMRCLIWGYLIVIVGMDIGCWAAISDMAFAWNRSYTVLAGVEILWLFRMWCRLDALVWKYDSLGRLGLFWRNEKKKSSTLLGYRTHGGVGDYASERGCPPACCGLFQRLPVLDLSFKSRMVDVGLRAAAPEALEAFCDIHIQRCRIFGREDGTVGGRWRTHRLRVLFPTGEQW